MPRKRRNYPGHRRPPIAHKVDGHRRDGHSVSGYERGSGGRSSPSTVSRRGVRAEAFIITMKYKDGSSETINVIAPVGDYKKALDEAMEERTHKAKPVEINILDPSLGEVIKYLSEGVGTGLKYVKEGVEEAKPHVVAGVKKVGREARIRGTQAFWKARQFAHEKQLRRKLKEGTKAVGREIGRKAHSYAQRKEAEKLVNQSYSENLSKRALARTKLKAKYPEIYDNCDFSTREMRRITRKRERESKAREKKAKRQKKEIKRFFRT